MNVRVKTVIWLLSACGLASAQTISSNEAFQGLNWGDSSSTIRSRFPAAVEKALPNCNTDSSLKNKGVSCTTLVVPGYVVSGLSFNLSFYLSRDDKSLREVGLSLQQEMKGSKMAPEERTAFVAKCADLERLIAARYGRGEASSANSISDGDAYLNYHWYNVPASHITLRCWGGGYVATYLVEYSPKVLVESRKL